MGDIFALLCLAKRSAPGQQWVDDGLGGQPAWTLDSRDRASICGGGVEVDETAIKDEGVCKYD